MPSYMQPVQAGSLAQFLQNFQTQPPSEPPMPTLNSSSVEEPPLPPVASRNAPGGGSSGGARTPGVPPSNAHTATISAGMLLVMVFAALLI